MNSQQMYELLRGLVHPTTYVLQSYGSVFLFFFFTVYLYSAIVFRHFLFAMIILQKTRVLLLKTNHQFEQTHSKIIMHSFQLIFQSV